MACDPAMQTPVKKILEDLLEDLSKTVMVVLSIALGVFGLGVILDTYLIASREMESSYEATHPASLAIAVQNPDTELMVLLEDNPAITQVEERSLIPARIAAQNDVWYKTKLYVVDDFSQQRISTTYPLRGKAVPGTGEIIIENTSLSVIGLDIGEELNLKMPGSLPIKLGIAGSVQADGTNPAWMHEEVIGYINEDTLALFDSEQFGSRYLIILKGRPVDEQTILSFSEGIQSDLEEQGYRVQYITAYSSGSHPNAQQMSAILLLFRVFGVLAMLLSGILIFSIMRSILKRQARQIAIMKALGASTSRISLMYYLFVAIIGAVAALLSIPTAKVIADLLSDFTSTLLVFSVSSYHLPLWLYLLQFAFAVLLPVAVATIPIQKSCRVPVQEGLCDHGSDLTPRASGVQGAVGRLGNRLPFRSASLSLGFRNTFRKTSRLLLGVITLAVGGAVFMASINVQASLDRSFADSLATYQIDTEFVLSDIYPDSVMISALSGVEGIESFSTSLVPYASLLDEGEGDFSRVVYNNTPRVSTAAFVHTPSADLDQTYLDTERAFKDEGLDVISSISVARAEAMYDKHLYTIAAFLTGASSIVIIVGVISLVSLAGLSVYERMRELGIMRSFGATTTALLQIALVENLITGFLGFVLSVLVALPLSVAIGKQFGVVFLGRALPLAVSASGLIIWLLLTVLITTVVSVIAVRGAVSRSVSEVLA